LEKREKRLHAVHKDILACEKRIIARLNEWTNNCGRCGKVCAAKVQANSDVMIYCSTCVQEMVN
jgi:uncharacterized cysteine cluster protein YcgN (CxxCxxCC family)